MMCVLVRKPLVFGISILCVCVCVCVFVCVYVCMSMCVHLCVLCVM